MLFPVEHRSPTLGGFRTAFLRPQFALGEIVWRWSFGVALLATIAFCAWQYLDSLTVTNAEMFLLGTSQPALIGRALERIFHGSAPRLIAAMLVFTVCLAIAWILLSALSRRAIVSVVADYLRVRVGDPFTTAPVRASNISLMGLSALRVAVALAAIVGCVAAWIAAAKIGAQPSASPGSAFTVFTAIIVMVAAAWLFLNWFLSFASVFAASQGCGVFPAIVASAECCMERFGAVLAPSIWFGLAHILLFWFGTGAAFLTFGLISVLPSALVMAFIAVITLVYFVAVDFLYVGRMSAYIFVIEGLDLLPVPRVQSSAPPQTPPVVPLPEEGRVDPGELILSDVPLPAQS
jgi:hypothetical protein